MNLTINGKLFDVDKTTGKLKANTTTNQAKPSKINQQDKHQLCHSLENILDQLQKDISKQELQLSDDKKTIKVKLDQSEITLDIQDLNTHVNKNRNFISRRNETSDSAKRVLSKLAKNEVTVKEKENNPMNKEYSIKKKRSFLSRLNPWGKTENLTIKKHSEIHEIEPEFDPLANNENIANQTMLNELQKNLLTGCGISEIIISTHDETLATLFNKNILKLTPEDKLDFKSQKTLEQMNPHLEVLLNDDTKIDLDKLFPNTTENTSWHLTLDIAINIKLECLKTPKDKTNFLLKVARHLIQTQYKNVAKSEGPVKNILRRLDSHILMEEMEFDLTDTIGDTPEKVLNNILIALDAKIPKSEKQTKEDIKCVAFGIIDYSTKRETDRVLGKTLGKLLSKKEFVSRSIEKLLSVKTRADLIFSDVFHSLIGATASHKERESERLQQHSSSTKLALLNNLLSNQSPNNTTRTILDPQQILEVKNLKQKNQTVLRGTPKAQKTINEVISTFKTSSDSHVATQKALEIIENYLFENQQLTGTDRFEKLTSHLQSREEEGESSTAIAALRQLINEVKTNHEDQTKVLTQLKLSAQESTELETQATLDNTEVKTKLAGILQSNNGSSRPIISNVSLVKLGKVLKHQTDLFGTQKVNKSMLNDMKEIAKKEETLAGITDASAKEKIKKEIKNAKKQFGKKYTSKGKTKNTGQLLKSGANQIKQGVMKNFGYKYRERDEKYDRVIFQYEKLAEDMNIELTELLDASSEIQPKDLTKIDTQTNAEEALINETQRHIESGESSSKTLDKARRLAGIHAVHLKDTHTNAAKIARLLILAQTTDSKIPLSELFDSISKNIECMEKGIEIGTNTVTPQEQEMYNFLLSPENKTILTYVKAYVTKLSLSPPPKTIQIFESWRAEQKTDQETQELSKVREEYHSGDLAKSTMAPINPKAREEFLNKLKNENCAAEITFSKKWGFDIGKLGIPLIMMTTAGAIDGGKVKLAREKQRGIRLEYDNDSNNYKVTISKQYINSLELSARVKILELGGTYEETSGKFVEFNLNEDQMNENLIPFLYGETQLEGTGATGSTASHERTLTAQLNITANILKKNTEALENIQMRFNTKLEQIFKKCQKSLPEDEIAKLRNAFLEYITSNDQTEDNSPENLTEQLNQFKQKLIENGITITEEIQTEIDKLISPENQEDFNDHYEKSTEDVSKGELLTLHSKKMEKRTVTQSSLTTTTTTRNIEGVTMQVFGYTMPIQIDSENIKTKTKTGQLLSEVTKETRTFNKYDIFNPINELTNSQKERVHGKEITIVKGLSKDNQQTLLTLSENKKEEFIKQNIEILEIYITQKRTVEQNTREKGYLDQTGDLAGINYDGKENTTLENQVLLFSKESIINEEEENEILIEEMEEEEEEEEDNLFFLE